MCGALREPEIVTRVLAEPPLLDAVVQRIGGRATIETVREPIDDDTLEQLIHACDAALEHLEAEARRRGMEID